MSLSDTFHPIKYFIKSFALLEPLVGNQIIDLTGDIPLIKPNGRICFVACGSVKFTTQGQQPRTTAKKKKKEHSAVKPVNKTLSAECIKKAGRSILPFFPFI